MSLKSFIRQKLIGCPACYARYQRFKYRLACIRQLGYFLDDIKIVSRYSFWKEDRELPTGQLQAKLLFFYHKIEKGLSLPGKKRLFGLDVIPQVISLLEAWEDKEKCIENPIYSGALNSLAAYAAYLEKESFPGGEGIATRVRDFLASRYAKNDLPDTPLRLNEMQFSDVVQFDRFLDLCRLRRSFRTFSDRDVSDDMMKNAIEAAQLSPSACNRQPCKVYAVRDPEIKRALLSHQNGNAGFGHLAPLVLAITADSTHFFGAIERHQIFVDGGLFSMSLIFGLQTQGLVSCCLNWCVSPRSDAAAHKVLGISESERIIMLMLVGFPPKEALVPKSHRRSVETILAVR